MMRPDMSMHKPAAVLLFLVFATLPARAQTGRDIALSADAETDGTARMYRRVKAFDFNERSKGNYESVPMHWKKLTGPGLPGYVKGRFDEEIGHNAPPSFRLDLRGSNVAYAYQQSDLSIERHADYTIVAYARGHNLKHARGFIAATFLDRFGAPIEGANRVSDLVGATTDSADSWRRIEVPMVGDFPDAVALRLELWLAQRHGWAEPDLEAVDQIVRQDINATVWFDDITVYRLPRARLRLSNPGGIVTSDAREHFVLDVHNSAAEPLSVELTVTDAAGRLLHRAERTVPPYLEEPLEVPVPELRPGFYRASLRLLLDVETLFRRQISFVVLPDLNIDIPAAPEFAIDLGRWQRSRVSGAVELIANLGCGAARIGIPAIGPIGSQKKRDYLREISELARLLARRRIDPVGVVLSPDSGPGQEPTQPTHAMVAAGGVWRQKVSPVLAHFGGLLNTWQLGDEAVELRELNGWTDPLIDQMRELLRRFATTPRLVVPRSVFSVPRSEQDIPSFLLPSNIAARDLPRYLLGIGEQVDPPFWLRIGFDLDERFSQEQRLADLARRIILAKAAAPNRTIVDAPFGVSSRSGAREWQPDENYLILRTLFHLLAHKQAVGVLRSDDEMVAIIFEGNGAGCVAMWSWRPAPSTTKAEFYLGKDPVMTDLWGQRRPLKVTNGRAEVVVGQMPVIIESIHSRLSLLHASFSVEPTYLQAHKPEPRPVLRFRNHFDQPMTGVVRFKPPAGWLIEPEEVPIDLSPGERFEQPLNITIPPRHAATTIRIEVRIELRTPSKTELTFMVPLTVGLRDIDSVVTTRWVSGGLIVEHALTNRSDRVVSFRGFCDAPNHARIERVFRKIPPGQTHTQRYRYRGGLGLRNTRLHVGLREIRGRRTLDQLVDTNSK